MDKIDIPSLGGVFAAPWSVKKLLGLLAILVPPPLSLIFTPLAVQVDGRILVEQALASRCERSDRTGLRLFQSQRGD